MKKNFDVETLREMDLPDAAVEDRIIDTGRWSIHHEIVFEDDGKHWRTQYSEAATEMQWEEPWEYQDSVEADEVELRDVVVKKWVPVESSPDAGPVT